MQCFVEFPEPEQYDVTAKKISIIVRHLKRHGGKASRRQLLNATKTKVKDFTEIIQSLIESETIRVVEGENKGDRTTMWFCLREDH